MNNNELFEKHVINVMDSYCRYYDVKKEIEAGKSIHMDSIFDINHTETFESVLNKVMEYVANYLKIDLNTITEEQLGRIRAHLYVKYQYRFMANKIITSTVIFEKPGERDEKKYSDMLNKYLEQHGSLIRYLQVFYVGAINKYKNEDGSIKTSPVKDQVLEDGTVKPVLTDDQIADFRQVYLEAMVEDEFQKFLTSYVRFLDLQDREEKKEITTEEYNEMDILDHEMANSYSSLDLKTDCAFKMFNSIVAKKQIDNDRKLFKFLYHKELLKMINPLSSSKTFADLLDGYAGKDQDKLEDIKTETGLLYGRLALLGHNDPSASMTLPCSVDKLDGDNLDCLTMFDTYFKLYDEGIESVNKIIKKM